MIKLYSDSNHKQSKAAARPCLNTVSFLLLFHNFWFTPLFAPEELVPIVQEQLLTLHDIPRCATFSARSPVRQLLTGDYCEVRVSLNPNSYSRY